STMKGGAENLLRELGETLGWDVGVFWTVQGDRLRYFAGWAASPGLEQFLERSRRTSFAPGDHLPGEAWTSDRAERISDIGRDPVFSRGATAREVGLNSGMALALRGHEEIFGVVEFFSHRVQSPAEAGLQVTELVVPQVEQFVQRVRAADETRLSREQAAESARRQRLMADTSLVLAESIDLVTGLNEVARLVTEEFAEWCTIELLADEALERVAWMHRDPAGAQRLRGRPARVPLSELGEATREALREGRAERVAPEWAEGHEGTTRASMLRVPLFVRDHPIGLLRLGRGPHLPPFRADELTLARDLAGRTSVVMENRRLQLEAEAAKRRLEAVLAQLPAGVVLADPDGRIEFANEVAKPYLEDIRAPLPPDAPLMRALAGEIVVQEEQQRHREGEPRVLLTNAAPITDGAGRTDGAVVTFL